MPPEVNMLEILTSALPDWRVLIVILNPFPFKYGELRSVPIGIWR